MQTRAGRLAIAAGLTVAASLALAAGAAAATIEVDTTADQDEPPGPPVSGSCSLREATVSANLDTATGGCGAGSGADTITFDPGVFDGTPHAIDLATVGTELVLDSVDGSGIEIQGPGSNELTVTNMNTVARIFFLSDSGDQNTISGLEITSGTQSGAGTQRGGGIRSTAQLALEGVAVRNNTVSALGSSPIIAAAAEGAGIWSDGPLTIENSVVEGNTATTTNSDDAVDTVYARGGGIWHSGGGPPLTIRNSSIGANIASSTELSTSGAATLHESAGGGIYADNAVTIEQSTFAGNSVSAASTAGSATAKGESDYGFSHCSTGPFPRTISYTVPGPPPPPPVVTPPPAGTTPAAPAKKCKKGFVKKRGKCVRKKRKKGTK